MRRIYKRATSVQVWLGEEADDSSLAIDLLNTLGAPPKHAPGERSIEYPSFTSEEVLRHWNALKAFFKRPWWERVWIRQEIALSTLVKIYCGSRTFDMNKLDPALFMLSHIASLGFVNTVSHANDENTVSLPWDFHPKMLVELRKRTSNGQSWVGLAQLLRMTRSCKATDARDTVFSVLGLADSDVYRIDPNYRQELNEVLFNAVRAVVGVEHGLDVLGVCQNPEKKFGLPSWMPFLMEKWRAMPFTITNDRAKRFMPCLTKSEGPNVRIDGRILELQGDLVDTVNFICTSYVTNSANAESVEFVYASWRRFANDIAARQLLAKEDYYTLVSGTEPELTRHWIRFLTVLADEAQDLDSRYAQPGGKKNVGPDAFLDDPMTAGIYRHLGLNPRLSRCYLLPSSYSAASPHPNYRVHAGLQKYGVGRRLCATSRGFLALIPAEARTGDPIALVNGASFPYVLRRSTGDADHVLVGEAFVPTWLGPVPIGPFENGVAEGMMRVACNASMNSWIRVC